MRAAARRARLSTFQKCQCILETEGAPSAAGRGSGAVNVPSLGLFAPERKGIVSGRGKLQMMPLRPTAPNKGTEEVDQPTSIDPPVRPDPRTQPSKEMR